MTVLLHIVFVIGGFSLTIFKMSPHCVPPATSSSSDRRPLVCGEWLLSGCLPGPQGATQQPRRTPRGSPCICPSKHWLSFRNVEIHVFHQVGDVDGHYSSPARSPLCAHQNAWGCHTGLPGAIYFSSFLFLLQDWIISWDRSSSLLTVSSPYSNLTVKRSFFFYFTFQLQHFLFVSF